MPKYLIALQLALAPSWLDNNHQGLQNNLNDMASRYGKEVMIVEVGGDYNLVQNTYDMLVAVIAAVKNVLDIVQPGTNWLAKYPITV